MLQDIKTLAADAVYCLGDLVDYGPFPNEVIELIQRDHIPTILGNHDEAVAFDRAETGGADRGAEINRWESLAFQWTKAHTTVKNKAFLQSLSRLIRLEADGRNFLLAHGSPRRINEYLDITSPLPCFQAIARDAEADVIIGGHTHRPFTKQVDKTLFVNVGSVGRPKDGDLRSCYAVVETTDGRLDVSFRRVSYALSEVTDAIRRTTIPYELAEQLERGA